MTTARLMVVTVGETGTPLLHSLTFGCLFLLFSPKVDLRTLSS